MVKQGGRTSALNIGRGAQTIGTIDPLHVITAAWRVLLRDRFMTPEAAPLASPRTCEPGPGSLVITDLEDKLSISAGNLVCTGGKAVPAYGDPRAISGRSFTVAPRLCFQAQVIPGSIVTWGDFGFYTVPDPSLEAHRCNFRFNDDATISIADTDEPWPGLEPGLMPFSAFQPYEVMVLCTAIGRRYYYAISGGAWVPIWATETVTTSPLYAGYANYNLPWTSEYGQVIERSVPTPDALDTFTRASSAVTLGTDETGNAWVPVAGTWGVATNEGYCVTDNNLDLVRLAAGNADGIWDVTIRGTLNSAVNYRSPALVVRYSDYQNFLAVYLLDGGMYLVKIDGGVLNALGVVATLTADATDYNLRVIAVGNDITVIKDADAGAGIWVVLAGGDTKYANYTDAGLALVTGGVPAIAARWDDFQILGPIRR